MKQKGFSTVTVLVVVVVLGLVGGAGWLVFQKLNKPRTADAVLARLTSDADATFANADFRVRDAWTAEMSATGHTSAPGYDYKIASAGPRLSWILGADDGARTVRKFLVFKKTLQPAKNADQVKEFAGKRLTAYGFVTDDNKTYRKNDVTCMVLNDPTNLLGGDSNEPSNVVDVNCFDDRTLRDTAAHLRPFVEAYLAANPRLKAQDLSVGPLTVKSRNGVGVISSSHAAGYDIAEMTVTTAGKKQIVLFYAKDADVASGKNSGWRYVTQADDEFGFRCGPMKADPEARKALYNQVCLSENGQIRLDTANRALQ